VFCLVDAATLKANPQTPNGKLDTNQTFLGATGNQVTIFFNPYIHAIDRMISIQLACFTFLYRKFVFKIINISKFKYCVNNVVLV
jgi:hypothetical protein